MNKASLLQALHQGDTVITPNFRLSEYFKLVYGQHLGKTVWPTPNIFPLSLWLKQTWSDILIQNPELPWLMSETQQQLLWHKVVYESLDSMPLLSPNETTQMALKAYQLNHEWCLSDSSATTDDIAYFYQLKMRYLEICQSLNFIDHHALANHIIDNISQVTLPKHIIFACFQEMPPAYQKLLDCFTTNQVEVSFYKPSNHLSKAFKLRLPHREAEIEHVLHWAKCAYLDQQKRIGCVFPNLKAMKHQVLRKAKHILPAGSFNISAGEPLDNYPIVAFALRILSLPKKLDWQTLSLLLLSPFWEGGTSEQTGRSMLEQQLLHENINEISIKYLHKQIASQEQLSSVPIFQKHLAYIDSTTFGNLLPSQWVAEFVAVLQALGFPGEASLSSHDYQVLNRFKSAMGELVSLDSMMGEISHAQALNALRLLCHSVEFQTQSPVAPIQILGTLEALGQSFDRLWVTGFDHDTWPQPPNPHPFIPLHLQRKLQMPHATAEREYQFSCDMLQQFLDASEEVYLSYAAQVDGQPKLPSSLIKHHSEIEPTPNTHIDSGEIFEYFDDNMGRALQGDEVITGGISVFTDQILCPFKAYAKHRLNTSSIASPSFGIPAWQKGQLVHRILELFWKKVQNHWTLCQLSDQEIQTYLNELIQKSSYLVRFTDFQGFLKSEQQRLENLLFKWILLEKNREPFQVIAIEQGQEIDYEGIPLRIRIDRMDQVGDKTIIIDYKTGLSTNSAWTKEPLLEPQLPLYTLLHPSVEAIAIAQIRADGLKLTGISKDDLGLKGVEPFASEWDTLKSRWQQTLKHTAKTFSQGHAEVLPQHQACQYCDLQTLCRIYDE